MLLQRVDLILLQCIDFVLKEKKGRIGTVVVVVGTSVIVLCLVFVVCLVVVLFCFLYLFDYSLSAMPIYFRFGAEIMS